MLEAKHQVKHQAWIVWGHSMGGAVVYSAMAQNPTMFGQLNRIVLEAPAFASRLTFGSKFTIWLSEPLYKSVIGRPIGRKITEVYIFLQRTAPEVAFYKPLEIEGFADSYTILHQVMASLKSADNNFDPQILQSVSGKRLLWVWSSNDQAVHADPPEVIPPIQQIRLDLGHTSSLDAPQEVCNQVHQRINNSADMKGVEK